MNDDIPYQQAKYLTSAPDLDTLPPDVGVEVAFIGRSNAGKSSSLNTLTGIKGLARTSKTPGRTQMINFFSLDENCRLVDLPGYGYAKVPRTLQERWEQNVDRYLQVRRSLKGLVVIMDIRHPMKESDQIIINWACQCQVPLHILLTKADKLTAHSARKILKDVSDTLAPCAGSNISIQLFSALDRTGLEELKVKLNQWFLVNNL